MVSGDVPIMFAGNDYTTIKQEDSSMETPIVPTSPSVSTNAVYGTAAVVAGPAPCSDVGK